MEDRVQIAGASPAPTRTFPTPVAPRVELRGSWAVPPVELVGDNLAFDEAGGARPRTHELFGVEPGLLAGFAGLHHAHDADLVAFAAEWGPLGLCQHEMPNDHIPRWVRAELRKHETKQLGDECRRSIGPEPLAAWRRWSASAAALIATAELLQAGRVPMLQDWRPVAPLLELDVDRMMAWPDKLDEPDRPDPAARDYVALYGNDPALGPLPSADAQDFSQAIDSDGRLLFDADGTPVWVSISPRPTDRVQIDAAAGRQVWLLGHAVDRWLTLGGVRVGFEWTTSEEDGTQHAHLGPTTDSLFGALGVQLAMTIGGVSALGQCYGCRLPYQPDRFGSTERHGYCPGCREAGVAKKVWTREQRQSRHWLDADAAAERAARLRPTADSNG